MFFKDFSIDTEQHHAILNIMRERTRSAFLINLICFLIIAFLYITHSTEYFSIPEEKMYSASIDMFLLLPLLPIPVNTIYFFHVYRLDKEKPELGVLDFHINRNAVRDNFSLILGGTAFFAVLAWLLLPLLMFLVDWVDAALFGSRVFGPDFAELGGVAVAGEASRDGDAVGPSWITAYPGMIAPWQRLLSYLFLTLLTFYLTSTAGVVWLRWVTTRRADILVGVLFSTAKTVVFFVVVELAAGNLFLIDTSESAMLLTFVFLLNFFLNMDQEAELAASANKRTSAP